MSIKEYKAKWLGSHDPYRVYELKEFVVRSDITPGDYLVLSGDTVIFEDWLPIAVNCEKDQMLVRLSPSTPITTVKGFKKVRTSRRMGHMIFRGTLSEEEEQQFFRPGQPVDIDGELFCFEYLLPGPGVKTHIIASEIWGAAKNE